MTAPVILVEASPRRVADGIAETVRLAGAGASRPYRYPDAAGGGDQNWRAGIVSLPTVICGLEFDGTDLGTGAVPQATEIAWAPARSADLDAVAAYFWFDADIKVRIGPEGASPPVVISGKVLNGTVADGQLRLQLADPAARLKKPFPVVRYLGTGGLEGPVEWTGKIKDRVWGQVWNKLGEPLDRANNIYAFADPTRPLQSISAVRDKGAAAAALTTVAWQGTATATLAALRAAAAPAGGGVLCPSLACVKWWTQPAGSLCADLKGEIGIGYVETTAEIAGALVAALGGPGFTPGTVDAAKAARPAAVGWVVKDDTTTVATMLDDLFGNASLLWVLSSSGQISIRQWAWGASVAAAKSQKVTRNAIFRPIHTRKIGYQRNELPMARGDLAAIVLASDATYSDGTPIEALKPAQPGATVGAQAGVNLQTNGGVILTDAQIKNDQITVGANGALSGGGGGQVTIGGLGFTGALNATYGATWAGTVTGRPTNLAALSGAESVNNAGVTIGSNGALSGGGGGQVTMGGLGFTGDLAATSGQNLAINGSFAQGQTGYSLYGGAVYNGLSAGAPAPASIVLPAASSGAYLNNGAYIPAPAGKLFVSADFISGGGANVVRFAVQPVDAANNSIGPQLNAYVDPIVATWGRRSIAVDLPLYTAKVAVVLQKITHADNVQVTNFQVATVEQNATLGATWTSNITSRPTNLAALAGGEPIQNSGVSIGANGTLSGGGGGQVTFAAMAPAESSKLSAVEALADVTKVASGPASIALNYASNGTTLTSALPKNVTGFTLTAAGGSAYTSGVVWAVSVLSGAFSGTPPSASGAGSGTLSLNSGMDSADALVAMTPTYGGKTYPPAIIKVTKNIAAPTISNGTTSGGGSTGGISGSLATGFAAMSPTLTCTIGSSGSATLAASGNIFSDAATICTVTVKWQRESSPGTWADVGAAWSGSVGGGASRTFSVPATYAGSGSQNFRIVAAYSSNVGPVSIDGNASVQG